MIDCFNINSVLYGVHHVRTLLGISEKRSDSYVQRHGRGVCSTLRTCVKTNENNKTRSEGGDVNVLPVRGEVRKSVPGAGSLRPVKITRRLLVPECLTFPVRNTAKWGGGRSHFP